MVCSALCCHGSFWAAAVKMTLRAEWYSDRMGERGVTGLRLKRFAEAGRRP